MWPDVHVSETVSLDDFGISDAGDFVRGVLDAVFRCEQRELRLSVFLCASAEMRALHARWLDDDSDTDVLSFPLDAGADAIELAQGELVVCVDYARRSARDHGNSADAELALYLVHGALHLLGYDDSDAQSLTDMKRGEKRVLDALSYSVRSRFDQA